MDLHCIELMFLSHVKQINVLSTNTALTFIAIVNTNTIEGGNFNGDSSEKSPWWPRQVCGHLTNHPTINQSSWCVLSVRADAIIATVSVVNVGFKVECFLSQECSLFSPEAAS